MRTTLTLAVCLAAIGCSPGAETQAEGDAPAPSTTVTTTTSPAPLNAAVVAETEAGSAPALIRVAHQTTRFVTLGLAGALFDKVPADAQVDPQLAVSADIASEVKVGYCETPESQAPCVFVKLNPITGPNTLVPTSAYTLWVDELPDAKWSLDIQTEPAEPFLALRIDAAGTGPRTADVTFSDGESLHFVLPNHGGPSAYVRLPVGAALTAISYLDPLGVAHTGALEVPLDGAFAYSITVDSIVPDAAVASIELVDGS